MRVRFHKHTVEGRTPALDAMYRSHFAAIAPEVEVEISTLPPAAYDGSLPEGSVRAAAAEAFFATDFVRHAIAAERAGCDAFVIGTSQDPGLREARSVVGIPVVGYGEAAMHISAMTGRSFGFVGFIPELATPIGDNVRAAGLSHRLAGFAYLPGGADAIRQAFAGDPAQVIEQFRAAARSLIAKGAEVIIPGEGLPNEILYHHGIYAVDGVPIADAGGLALQFAIFLVQMRRLNVLGPTTTGYWHTTLSPMVVDHLSRTFLTPAPDTVSVVPGRTPAGPENG